MCAEFKKGAIRMKEKWSRNIRKGSLLLLALLLVMGLAACGGSNKDEGSSRADSAAAPMAEGAFNDQMSFTTKAKDSVQVTMSNSVAAGEAEASSAPQEALQSTSEDARVGGGGIGPIADANAGFDRKVIYRANLVMKVAEFAAAEEQLQSLIHLSGAYVLQFSDSQSVNEVGATYVIKVPSQGFSSFLEQLQKIKNLKLERKVEGSDVTEEFVDLEARLKAKQTVEERLLAFMDKATKSDDLVRFSNELGNVQQEIEQIKGRIRYLDQNVAFSTINLRLYQSSGIVPLDDEVNEEKGFAERISDALSGSTKALKQFGEGLLVVVAAVLPVLIVLSIIGIPVYYLVRRRQNIRRRNSEENRKSWNDQQMGAQETTADMPSTELDPKSDVGGQQTEDEDR
jgi:uncharacterized lipoprotein YehR (DUF1307 family)